MFENTPNMPGGMPLGVMSEAPADKTMPTGVNASRGAPASSGMPTGAMIQSEARAMPADMFEVMEAAGPAGMPAVVARSVMPEPGAMGAVNSVIMPEPGATGEVAAAIMPEPTSTATQTLGEMPGGAMQSAPASQEQGQVFELPGEWRLMLVKK